MTTLVIALALASVGAAVFGGLLGLCTAFAKAEGDPTAHSFLAMLTRRSNPLFNIFGALSAWAVVLYGLPNFTFWLLGLDGAAVFGITFAVQLCAIVFGFFIGEHLWKHIE